MARAWTFQDSKQKELPKGTWSVGWISPDGRRHSKRIGSKSVATKYARKLEGQLVAGVYQGESRKKWSEFRQEYEAKILGGMSVGNGVATAGALDHFERIANPQQVQTIKTVTIDSYVAKRRTERGRKPSSTIAAATVNKELRHIKAVLRVANEWGYLPTMPKVRMLKEPGKLITYVTGEHFALIYQACDVATRPGAETYGPADWWRGVLTFAYMTGWRIGEILALRWDDVSLDTGEAITRAEHNKGKRDERVPLHPIVVEHLRRIIDFGPLVFPWPHEPRVLWRDFGRIQEAAGIGTRYGFHDLRRAFATVNAPRLTGDALQSLMRHRSYTTTQRYIHMARQLDEAVQALHVPEVLRKPEL